MDWIDLAGDRDEWWAVVNTVMNIWVPYSEKNLLTGEGSVSVSGRTVLCAVSQSVSQSGYGWTIKNWVFRSRHWPTCVPFKSPRRPPAPAELHGEWNRGFFLRGRGGGLSSQGVEQTAEQFLVMHLRPSAFMAFCSLFLCWLLNWFVC
jgi:hypothetical protein